MSKVNVMCANCWHDEPHVENFCTHQGYYYYEKGEVYIWGLDCDCIEFEPVEQIGLTNLVETE